MDKQTLAIPVAIVVAAALIAGAIFFSDDNDSSTENTHSTRGEVADISPVNENDFIRGNPNAPIVLVEYSDYDCPFCKQFHETMERVMAEYGVDGKVAWVYRQFPLVQLHPNAPRISEAALCVGELGGNEAFWTFSDLVFEERPDNEVTEIARLPEFAERAGVEQNAFELCLNSGKHAQAVADSVNEAVASGARGTPHTFVLVGDQSGTINGAQPYSVVKQIIDTLLEEMGGV